MHLSTLVQTSDAVSATRSRLRKIALLTALLRELPAHEIAIGVAYLTGVLPQGRIGLGPATLRQARMQTGAAHASLTLQETDGAFARVAEAHGQGSATRRREALRALYAKATAEEQEFLSRLVLGELRQGALEGVMLEAIARAADVGAREVRRAVMLAGDAGTVARAVLSGGRSALGQFSLVLMKPVTPMLAQPAEQLDAALAALGEAALEYKLDGARVQVHKLGRQIRIFTRQLNEVTASVPELVETVRAWPARQLILDGEAIALHADGRPRPFQVTMRRFGRKLDVDTMRARLALSALYFDCLHVDGEDLIDRPAAARFEALSAVVPGDAVIPRLVTSDRDAAAAFLRQALDQGHEGLMAKALDACYKAGSRGASWRKIKPTHTLDLVVLAAEWGSGRRQGWLSNLHLGARDPDDGGFAMLGKTFKGLTDAMLRWQTERLLALEIGREAQVVHVRPELVVEVAFNGVQRSPHYPAGYALRFARVKRYRQDKRASEADTIDTVRELARLQDTASA